MKRKLVLFIASLLILGSINAQEDHWSMNSYDYMNARPFYGKAMIDGVIQSTTDIEIAAFVGEQVRAVSRLKEISPSVLPGQYFIWFNIKYNNAGEPVTFKIYDHATNTEYDNYTITVNDEPISVVTGMDNPGSASVPVMLDFITPTSSITITKAITGFGTGTGKWYLISSPLANATSASDVGSMLSNSFDLYRFNQSADLEWENWKQTDDDHYHFDLEPGKGYLYANSEDVTLTFSGEPYSGNGQVTLVKDDNAEFAGWNLVGNPFNTTATLNMPFYKMNEDGDGFTAKIEDLTNTIGAMEGVFVQATTDGQIAMFTPTSGSKGVATAPVLNISLSQSTARKGATTIDNAIVRFDGGQRLGKFTFHENDSKVFIPQDGTNYAVVNSENIGKLPVSFKAKENGSYTISVNAEDLDFSHLHLIDNKTGADINLLETPSYTFEAQFADYANRFRLVFATGTSTSSETFGFISGGQFIVLNEGEATLEVIDMLGHIVSSKTINGNSEINLNDAAGVYVIRLINGEKVKVQKIVVR